jgi:thiol-disulfide isomerase/thioredoxin
MKKTIQILLFIFCVSVTVSAEQKVVTTTRSQIPEKFIGNWINLSTNHWEYGFFEKFAMYKSDFWDYKTVQPLKNGDVNLTLAKGKQTVQLLLQSGKDNRITIQSAKGNAVLYTKMDKIYPAYPQKNETAFAKPTFRKDSATIIGYYRNRDKIPAQFADRLKKSTFMVSAPDFISGKEQSYLADFDSLGRFKLTFPIMNAQELYVDWRGLQLHMSLEAGNTIALFVDLADYIPLEADKSREGYENRPKQVLFMGDNARFNNELTTYKPSSIYTDRNKSEKLSDMAYLLYCDSVSKKRMEVLNSFIIVNPNVSKKFREFNTEYERYNLAFYLMQHWFDLRRKNKTTFDPGYMDYVRANFPLTNEWAYTGVRDFKSFLRDYIDYETSLKPQKPVTILFKDMAKHIKQYKKVDDATISLLDQMTAMNEEFDKAGKDQVEALQTKYKELMDKLQTINPLLQEASAEIFTNRPLDTQLSDSLLTNEHLRQMWNASSYYAELDQQHKALSEAKVKDMRVKVVNPDLIKIIENVNNFYKNVATKGMTYEASLKNTSHLKEYQDAKTLFEELIKPYKGKVIYVDFWGTWCGPCKENMKYVKDLKAKLKGQDVIFMYFANNSPEDSWKNIIKEMDLTGENVVQYRLPEKQEEIIERLFSVNSFPTYLLVNKEGKVVNTKAASPIQGETVVQQISELLK